ncbi:hypothetical protein [Methanobacterium sp. SMA-27]|uniref:hypothetical protein n=1 Tax=Methanobacterium sp. SMA-27 TaxID=1495336 RepID=UPI00064E76C2|nr:hypothetical protein [Methanobacterium sp. SMA-27]
MKAEFKRLKENFIEVVWNIPIDELTKIYYKQSYDTIRTLRIDKDHEEYKIKADLLMKFIKKMTYHQRRTCIVEEVKAYNQVLDELQLKHRTENLTYICSMVSDAWFINRVNDFLDAYDESGDDFYYNEAKNLICQLNTVHDKISNPEKIKSMERYVENLKTNEDLTEEEIKKLDYLKLYIESYHLSARINCEEEDEND